jgi:hypothetical protein
VKEHVAADDDTRMNFVLPRARGRFIIRVSLAGIDRSYKMNAPDAGVVAEAARPTRTVTADAASFAIMMLDTTAVVEAPVLYRVAYVAVLAVPATCLSM